MVDKEEEDIGNHTTEDEDIGNQTTEETTNTN